MSEEKEKNKNKNKGSIGIFVASFVVVAIIAFIIVILNYGSEKQSSVEYTDSNQKTLICDSGPNEEAFFTIDNASRVKHEIKVMFIDDKISKFFYMYDGKFKDETEAEYGSTDMHIKYDRYLGANKYDSSSKVSATFNHPGTGVRIDVYTGAEGINPATAAFFFLDKDNLNELMKKGGEELKSYYKKKGFDCKYE